MKRKRAGTPIIAAVSGGPDSVFLLERLVRKEKRGIVVAHINHGLRGQESENDEKLVEELALRYGLDLKIKKDKPGKPHGGIEEKARKVRKEFLERLSEEYGGVVATGHTADDQVETILMRFFEGAGIAGLKGIPRNPSCSIERPILDIWKEDILKYLKQNNISFRVDRSNRDTRFERNWVRNVLVPLLEGRYGKAFKKRIIASGERFRELDDYLESEASRWTRRNIKGDFASAVLPRKTFSGLPAALRIRILQKICFGLRNSSPNERLLAAMDKSIRTGKPSNKMKIGNGWELSNRYEEARITRQGGLERKTAGKVRMKDAVEVTPAGARRIAARGNAEVFDSDGLLLPLSVRPLRHGDRILPFGQSGEKKLKEILIDRKVPREERWGRPAVCDSEGTILWIPGVLRSGHAPVTPKTRCAKIISYFG